MSTHSWKILTTADRIERRFPITKCEHVFLANIKDDDTACYLFHRKDRWYYMEAKEDKLTLRRANVWEYCAWQNRINENDYAPDEQYFSNTLFDT